MVSKYILIGHIPVQASSLEEWAEWFEKADRHVAKDQIGDVRISTVFLGIDHNFGEGDPLLFVTMVFGGKFDGEQENTSTWAQAEEAHKRMVELVNGERSLMMDYKEFSIAYENEKLNSDFASRTGWTLEELYQAFKKRLLKELEVPCGNTEGVTEDGIKYYMRYYEPLHDKTAEKKG